MSHFRCNNQQLLGHNFPYAGANCSSCGVSQYSLSRRPKKTKREYEIKKQKKGAYSEIQALAIDIWEQFGKDSRLGVGQIIGTLKRKGLRWGYQTLSEARQEGISIELFMHKSRG